MRKIFIDGSEGTTGLHIVERFEGRGDVELLQIAPELRKDSAERKKFLNTADIAFLCLPDAAAREAVAMIENPDTCVIDASTAHRTDPAWTYGLPELSEERRRRIRDAKRVAVPGCHATGFIVLIYPLVNMGILPAGYPLTCHSLTGYSGGGKTMIAEYRDEGRGNGYNSPRQYALTQQHKHLPEMRHVCGLESPPVFSPIAADYYAGMAVTVPLHPKLLSRKMTALDIHAAMMDYYKNEYFVRVRSLCGETELERGFLPANALAGTNDLEIFVCGNDDRIILVSRFDNLGKGSSGAAVQCMNIMLGIDEKTGL